MAKNLFPLIARRIDSIPTLPLSLRRLFEATARGDQSNAEIGAILQCDPALTAKVLKVMNSPFYGLRFKVSTLSHAIAMLGIPALSNLAAGISTFAAPSEPAADAKPSMDKERYWLHSLAAAAAARAIAVELEYDLPEEAWIGGLLHDFGRVVLDLYAPEALAACIAEHEDGAGSIVELERRILGVDHAQAGALIAEKWNFPRILKDAIQFHHEPPARLKGFPRRHRELVGIVAAADRLCWAYGLGGTGTGRLPADEIVVGEGACLTAEQIDRVLSAVHAEFEAVATRLDVAISDGSDFLACLKAANAAASGDLAARTPGSSLTERIASAAGVIRRARRFQSVDEMIEGSLRSIRTSLDLDRVLYFKVDLDEERLQGRYFFDDTRIGVAVHEIVIPLNPDGVLGTALRDGVPQRVDNWATDGELLRFLGVVEVAAAPVVVSHQPVGVLCADSFFRNREITDVEVTLLGMVATDLALAVENLVLTRQAAKLRSLASRDELTGIHNRRSLMKLLQKEIERANRYGSPLSAVMIDIDHFKTFNDTYGHQAGDSILADVAQLISAASREIDVIGRYGGEEFLIVLPETPLDQAILYAERLRSLVEGLGRERKKIYPRCDLTISAGVASLTRNQDDLEQFIHRVDHAMYAAKERGRNCVI